MLRRLKHTDPDLYQIFVDAPLALGVGLPFCIAMYSGTMLVGLPIVSFAEAVLKKAVFG